MKKKTIYVNQSQELLSLFEETGFGRKGGVLIEKTNFFS